MGLNVGEGFADLVIAKENIIQNRTGEEPEKFIEMKGNYIKQLDGTWKCRRCEKIVKEFGWSPHNAWHRKKAIWDKKSRQMHIDIY